MKVRNIIFACLVAFAVMMLSPLAMASPDIVMSTYSGSGDTTGDYDPLSEFYADGVITGSDIACGSAAYKIKTYNWTEAFTKAVYRRPNNDGVRLFSADVDTLRAKPYVGVVAA